MPLVLATVAVSQADLCQHCASCPKARPRSLAEAGEEKTWAARRPKLPHCDCALIRQRPLCALGAGAVAEPAADEARRPSLPFPAPALPPYAVAAPQPARIALRLILATQQHAHDQAAAQRAVAVVVEGVAAGHGALQ